jgi:hypothetical protein
MNSDERTRYITWGVAIFGSLLVRWGIPADMSTTLIGAIVDAGAQIAPVAGAAAFAIYKGLNKRLVHENAVVTSVAPTVADAKAASIPAGK